MKKLPFLLAGLLLGFTAVAQSIGSNTRIDFEISNFSMNTVEGSFTDFRGSVNFDPEKASEADFNIKVHISSIETGNDTRDADLLEKEYFNNAEYPYALFSSTTVSKSGDVVTVTGILTIKGHSEKITIPFKLSRITSGYLLSGKITLDRYDFKVGSSGGFMIGREAELSIQCYLLN